MPSSGRTSAASATTSWPSTAALPDEGSRIVERTLHSVVLPAPFGPSSPCTSPVGTSSDRPARAVTSAPLGRHPLPRR
ncbi:hypothetical protein JOF41_000156 [Saccharothrix coeruleofusca]|nr:hypothetical protein [Saccharothrix coeruleofusca]MBP2333978.1 hypothetical protein [Saccharothrix coeruleofusca]